MQNEKRQRDSWYKLDESDRYVDLSDYARPLAIKVVASLKDSSITSIHVTCLFILIGLLAAPLIVAESPVALISAALLLQLKNLLDAVDGSLARAQNKPSLVGRYLDSLGDFCVSSVVMLAFASLLVPRWGIALASLVAMLGLLMMLLQGSYYNFFSVLVQRERRGSVMSRLDERAPIDEGLALAKALQRLYLIIYGWQDRLVQRLVRWAQGSCDAQRHPALTQPLHLSWVSALGLGCQLALQSVCLLLHAVLPGSFMIELYFLLTLVLGQLVLVADLIYLRARR